MSHIWLEARQSGNLKKNPAQFWQMNKNSFPKQHVIFSLRMWLLLLFISPKKKSLQFVQLKPGLFCHHRAKISQKTKNKNTRTLVLVLGPRLNFGWYEAAIHLVLRLDKQIWYEAGITSGPYHGHIRIMPVLPQLIPDRWGPCYQC